MLVTRKTWQARTHCKSANSIKLILVFLSCCLIALVLYSPSSSFVENAFAQQSLTTSNVSKAKKLTINKEKASLKYGRTLKLKVSNTNGKRVTWKSSNSKIVKITKKGTNTATVKGLQAGTASIIGKANGNEVKCVIEIKPEIDKTKAYVNYGKTIKLRVKNNGGKKVTWKSSNSKIAKIIWAGENASSIKGMKKGFATITAKVNGVTNKCRISVKGDNSPNASNVVYALKKVSNYDSNGKTVSGFENEYDNSGFLVKQKSYSSDNISGKLVEVIIECSDFTSEGYPKLITSSAAGKNVYDYTFENGRAVEMKRNSVLYQSYTFYENGYMKTKSTFDKNGIDLLELVEYDKDGYTTRYVKYGENEVAATFEWSFENGKPTGYTAKFVSPTGSGNDRRTVECDDNGNIVRIYYLNGKLASECSYVKIKNPSTQVMIEAHKKSR